MGRQAHNTRNASVSDGWLVLCSWTRRTRLDLTIIMSSSEPPRQGGSLGAPLTSPSLLNPPRGVDHSRPPDSQQADTEQQSQHPHLHEAVRVAATHVLPQSPVPGNDELPHLAPRPAGNGLDDESEGVLAPRAGEVDLRQQSIGDVQAVRNEEQRMHRPGLTASRVGSVSFVVGLQSMDAR